MSNKKKTTEDFITEAKIIHNNKYDYSKTIYTGTDNNVIIICPEKEHGEFIKRPAGSHIRKVKPSGCPKCGIKMRNIKKRLTFDKFKQEAIFVHGDKYSYDKVVYIDIDTNVIIVCSEHGEFSQTPYNHIRRKQGCSECAFIRRITTRRFSKEEFIEKANAKHKNKYIYENVEYINSTTKIMVTCASHGDFTIIPNNHLQGKGCSLCVNKTEGKLLMWLQNNNYTVEYSKRFKWCKNERSLPFDFFIEDLDLLIELDGDHHFFQINNWNSPKKTQIIDKYKTKCANKKGISIIRIYQPDVWFDKNNWETQLLKAIKKYKEPINIYIGSIYQKHYKFGIVKNHNRNIFITNKKLSLLNALMIIYENINQCVQKSKKMQKYLIESKINPNNLKNQDTKIFLLEYSKICNLVMADIKQAKNILLLMIESK